MKILYLDLNDVVCEDYSIEPDRYGGGRIFAAFAKEKWATFHIYSSSKSFNNLKKGKDSFTNCHDLKENQRAALVAGARIKDVIPESEHFDLVVHHHSSYWINTEGTNLKQAIWAVGYFEDVNKKHENLLLYSRKHQNPRVLGNPAIYDVVIGNNVPEFNEYKKEDFLFFCSRQCPVFMSIEIAKICRNYNIPLVLAGKIESNYPLLNYVGGSVSYIGEVTQATKINYLKRAIGVPVITNWNCPFSLNLTEAQAYGCGAIVAPIAFLDDYVTEGLNGFKIKTADDFVNGYYKLKTLKQKDCYIKGAWFNKDIMLDSFEAAFKEILK